MRVRGRGCVGVSVDAWECEWMRAFVHRSMQLSTIEVYRLTHPLTLPWGVRTHGGWEGWRTQQAGGRAGDGCSDGERVYVCYPAYIPPRMSLIIANAEEEA
eukprot:GHVU01192733.1.p2 GENE.GHVU01192733.1~~GHVU01192733.1.p2  ORF type:complete len:101 (+),score=1.80 GHVU01192733.1:190-492(+)